MCKQLLIDIMSGSRKKVMPSRARAIKSSFRPARHAQRKREHAETQMPLEAHGRAWP